MSETSWIATNLATKINIDTTCISCVEINKTYLKDTLNDQEILKKLFLDFILENVEFRISNSDVDTILIDILPNLANRKMRDRINALVLYHLKDLENCKALIH